MATQTIRDVVVIGSGAGGGTLARVLARANWDVLVLEKGPRYTPADFVHDEIRRATSPELFVPSVNDDPHVLVDAAAGGERQLTTLGWIATCVGGGTVHMGGSLYRFHPDDFRLRSALGPLKPSTTGRTATTSWSRIIRWPNRRWASQVQTNPIRFGARGRSRIRCLLSRRIRSLLV